MLGGTYLEKRPRTATWGLRWPPRSRGRLRRRRRRAPPTHSDTLLVKWRPLHWTLSRVCTAKLTRRPSDTRGAAAARPTHWNRLPPPPASCSLPASTTATPPTAPYWQHLPRCLHHPYKTYNNINSSTTLRKASSGLWVRQGVVLSNTPLYIRVLFLLQIERKSHFLFYPVCVYKFFHKFLMQFKTNNYSILRALNYKI